MVECEKNHMTTTVIATKQFWKYRCFFIKTGRCNMLDMWALT